MLYLSLTSQSFVCKWKFQKVHWVANRVLLLANIFLHRHHKKVKMVKHALRNSTISIPQVVSLAYNDSHHTRTTQHMRSNKQQRLKHARTMQFQFLITNFGANFETIENTKHVKYSECTQISLLRASWQPNRYVSFGVSNRKLCSNGMSENRAIDTSFASIFTWSRGITYKNFNTETYFDLTRIHTKVLHLTCERQKALESIIARYHIQTLHHAQLS